MRAPSSSSCKVFSLGCWGGWSTLTAMMEAPEEEEDTAQGMGPDVQVMGPNAQVMGPDMATNELLCIPEVRAIPVPGNSWMGAQAMTLPAGL